MKIRIFCALAVGVVLLAGSGESRQLALKAAEPPAPAVQETAPVVTGVRESGR